MFNLIRRLFRRDRAVKAPQEPIKGNRIVWIRPDGSTVYEELTLKEFGDAMCGRRPPPE